jgi:hypothetical protein
VDEIQGMLDRLPELSDAELGTLETQIVSAFESAEAKDISRESVAEMTSLADSMDAVRAERARRDTEAADLAAQASDAAERIQSTATVDPPAEAAPDATAPPETFTAETPTPEPTEAATAEPVKAETPEPAAEAAAVEQPAEAAAGPPDEDEELPVEEVPVEEVPVEEVPVEDEDEDKTPLFAAQGGEATPTSTEAHMGNTAPEPTFSAPADRLPVPRPDVAPVPVSLVAGGDIPGVTAGSGLSGRMGLADAMSQRLHSLRRTSGGMGEQVVVASLLAQFPEDRALRTNDIHDNTQKITAVTEAKAIVASGGWCAPLPTNYDIFEIGSSTATPVRDALPTFNAERGGVRFVAPPTFGAYANAVGIWTNQNDIDAATQPGGPDKPCLTVVCASEVEVYLDAVTMCLCFGNLATRAFPELIALHNDLALVQAARVAETHILGKIKASSTAVAVPAATLGVAREILIAVERAAAYYRWNYRLPNDFPLRFVAPAHLAAMIRSDLTAQLPGDGQENTWTLNDARLANFFASRNIRPVWAMDNVAGGVAPTAIDYPDTVEWGLFAEGAYTLLDGGTLDIGIVRDKTLVTTNDYCMFTEQFLGVAQTGFAGLWATQPVVVNGSSAGTIDVALVDY